MWTFFGAASAILLASDDTMQRPYLVSDTSR